MQHEFWLEAWRRGRTDFHQARVLPLLQKYWPTLALPAGSQVFVPLAGKSLDMLWLAERGHRVLAVEISPLAVEQFFAEHQLAPKVHESRYGMHHVAGNIELILGDAFALDRAALAGCAAVYDRAALIALPPAMRKAYVDELYERLPASCHGLVLTIEYQQSEMAGPPFSVDEAEVRERYEPRWQVALLDRREILHTQPHFAAAGLTALSTAVYRLQHRTGNNA